MITLCARPVSYVSCPVGYTLWATENHSVGYGNHSVGYGNHSVGYVWSFSLVISAGCSPALTYPDCPDFPDVR